MGWGIRGTVLQSKLLVSRRVMFDLYLSCHTDFKSSSNENHVYMVFFFIYCETHLDLNYVVEDFCLISAVHY